MLIQCLNACGGVASINSPDNEAPTKSFKAVPTKINMHYSVFQWLVKMAGYFKLCF